MKGFKFGIEAEFLLARPSDWSPLWHRDVSFERLNGILESIPLDGLPDISTLELEPPHRKLMPYVVEGYHVPDQDMAAIDIRPKGLEIRTPVCDSLDGCLNVFETLLTRLQTALKPHDLAVVALSHHPTETRFEGPQNKRRHDFWQWAMEVMTTYGPDVNVSLPAELRESLSTKDLEAKIDHYGPALSALSVGAPFIEGAPWKIRGRVGKSFRMYKRSVIAPPIEIHPHEDGRLEFKIFDMPGSTVEFRCQFLCFLALLLTPDLKGRASRQSRVYDLGQVARFGLEAEGVRERLTEIFEQAPRALREAGFDPAPLDLFRQRLISGRTPADDLIQIFENEGGLPAVLAARSRFAFEGPTLG